MTNNSDGLDVRLQFVIAVFCFIGAMTLLGAIYFAVHQVQNTARQARQDAVEACAEADDVSTCIVAVLSGTTE
ncbi:hypothetical protein [Nitrosomonas sp.]|uniref:hypothetical protein n=1 Tax=Nitrosomonas sp. TaxID=42353 RepID=UPI0025D3A449|nr:hypothetical protein [Nitrosomonas sp.]MBV6448542.1 hypothetical protein [Nitrosomonas sp.]